MKKNKLKKLPDSEFEIMKVIWLSTPPITTSQIIKGLDEENTWKPQTILTLLMRLIDKGFLSSEKIGKERSYTPLVSEDEYLHLETNNFFNKYYKNSITSLVNTLYSDHSITKEDLNELKEWLTKEAEKNG